MPLPKKKLFLAFSLVSLLVTGSSLVVPSAADKKDEAFDCPEAAMLERQDTLNKLLGRNDAELEQALSQQHEACDNRALRKLHTGPGKTYNPWEDVESATKNWNSPSNFGI